MVSVFFLGVCCLLFFCVVHKVTVLVEKFPKKFESTISPPAPLQTEFSRFFEMKYLLEKETHNKNEENTLKELSKIFLTIQADRGFATSILRGWH